MASDDHIGQNRINMLKLVNRIERLYQCISYLLLCNKFLPNLAA